MAAGVRDIHFQLTIAQISKVLPTHMQATLTECNELQKRKTKVQETTALVATLFLPKPLKNVGTFLGRRVFIRGGGKKKRTTGMDSGQKVFTIYIYIC